MHYVNLLKTKEKSLFVQTKVCVQPGQKYTRNTESLSLSLSLSLFACLLDCTDCIEWLYAGSHLFLLSYIITELRGQIKVLISFELNVLGHIQPKYFIGGIVTGYNEHPTSFKHVQNLCKMGIIPLKRWF